MVQPVIPPYPAHAPQRLCEVVSHRRSHHPLGPIAPLPARQDDRGHRQQPQRTRLIPWLGTRLATVVLLPALAFSVAGCGLLDESVTITETALPPAANLTRPAIHGLWVATTDPALSTTQGVIDLFDRAQASGITDIYVQVAWRYASNWPSDRLYHAKAKERHVYNEVLNVGHDRNIRVHAWMTVMLAGQADSPNPLWREHGLSAPEDQRWVTRSVDGRWSDFLDPGVPQVRELAVATASELAAYSPDSVHLDFIRYPEDEQRVPGSEWGYNPIALARYYQDTGKHEPPATDDPDWGQWKRNQVTQIVREIKGAIGKVPLSAAVVTWGMGPSSLGGFSGSSAWTDVAQDWPGWAKEGLVDQLVVMNYFSEESNSTYQRSWANFAGQVRSTYPHTQVVLGQGTWINNAQDTLTQLGVAQDYVDGWALYANDKVPADLWPALPKGTPEPIAPTSEASTS